MYMLQTCAVLLTPIVLVISAFVGSGIVHILLMLFGGARYSYETTFRTLCYVKGAASVFALIPRYGQTIGWIWGIFCLIIALTQTQKASTGRAAAAVLAPFCLCCFCIAAVTLLLQSIAGWGIGQGLF